MRSGFHWQLRLQWCTAGEWPGTVVVAGGGEQSMGHRVAGRIGIGIGTGPAATTLGVAWRRVGRSCPRDHAWVLYGFGRLSSFPLPPWVDRWFGGSAATAAVATPACSTSQAGFCSAIQAASQGGRGIIIHGEILLAVMRRDSVSISGWIRSAAQHTLSAG
jgi:hypothetical protein